MLLKRIFVTASGFACAASVLLCFLSLFADYSFRLRWGDNPAKTLDLCFCTDGLVLGARNNDPYDVAPAERGNRHVVNARGNDPECFVLGAAWFHFQDYSVFILPFWMAIAASIVAPAGAAWRQIQRRRRDSLLAASLCLQCRYDLRAHQPGQRCPECGWLIHLAANAFPLQVIA
ncbi:MAG TPA: hypothetical protein VHM90_14450 [Phycisphaerae bacterium]|jgi:hypothetical protein|nr:hypothetical protein [Phycisphaerae bacterium]